MSPFGSTTFASPCNLHDAPAGVFTQDRCGELSLAVAEHIVHQQQSTEANEISTVDERAIALRCRAVRAFSIDFADKKRARSWSTAPSIICLPSVLLSSLFFFRSLMQRHSDGNLVVVCVSVSRVRGSAVLAASSRSAHFPLNVWHPPGYLHLNDKNRLLMVSLQGQGWVRVRENLLTVFLTQ